jgi:hypothetical protein
VGTLTTGQGAGKYLIAGPDWDGEKPKGTRDVFRSETPFIYNVTRTQLFGPDDLQKVKEIQGTYDLQPLSAFLGTDTPPAEALPNFPKWVEGSQFDERALNYLSFMLSLVEKPVPEEKPLWNRLARLGLTPSGRFDFAGLPSDIQEAVKAGIKEGFSEIEKMVLELAKDPLGSAKIFGTRDFLAKSAKENYGHDNYYLICAAAAHIGLYGNSGSEAIYPTYHTDADQQPLDASKHAYTLTFEKGKLPPAKLFWSLTMYDAKTQLFIENPLERYLLNSTTMGQYVRGEDGTLVFHISKESPGKDLEPNWLPAPNGPFYLVMRLYGPEKEALEGRWTPPALERVELKEATHGTETPDADAPNTRPLNTDASDSIDWEYQIVHQRGIEAVTWAIPAVSMLRFRDAYFSLGGDYNTVYYLTKPPTAQTEALTANNQTPYATVLMSTKDGPVVLDIPAASERTTIFGSAIDIWQEPVADIGPAGTDEGKGGRYLFLPPGYKDKAPDGFFVVPMDTYGIFVALRCIPLGDASFSEASEYSKRIRAYPLSQADNPPAGEYIDISGKHLPTLPVFDLSYFADISRLLEQEPLLERDKAMAGMLASIGLQKGKAFRPESKQKAALEQAIKDGRDYLEYLFETPGIAFEIYYPDRHWTALKQPSSEGFVFDEGDSLLLDARAGIFHFGTFIPRQLGKATSYLVCLKDSRGELLSGLNCYKLRVPADVPVRDFWSVIAYSKETKAFIYNDADRVGLSSYDTSSLKVNTDGTVDLYFGKTAPEGLESNWIPTAGEDFFLIFRFYGPEEAVFDKSFKLPDVEKID